MSKYKPAEVFPPGEYLKEYTDEMSSFNKTVFLTRLRNVLETEFADGNIPITPAIAEVLEECTGSSLWMRLDKQWQEYKKEKEADDNAEDV